MDYIISTPNDTRLLKYIDLPSGRVKINVGMEFGELVCSSEDGTYEGLNETVDELILGNKISGLLDINYKPIAVKGDLVIFEVDADISEVLDELENFLPGAVREAAINAVGNEELPDMDIYEAWQVNKSRKTKEMKDELKKLEAEFEGRGGRGVDLAEKIDDLRIVLAIKANCPNWK